YRLTAPTDGGGGLLVDRDGLDYQATRELLAPTAPDARDEAERTLRDLLAGFAARAASYAIVHAARRNIQLVDPAPVLEGPPPPFQSVDGVVTAAGAEALDPTGELRRQRR